MQTYPADEGAWVRFPVTEGPLYSSGEGFTVLIVDGTVQLAEMMTSGLMTHAPEEGSEALVLKVINSARHDIRMLSYSFTSAPVARALLGQEAWCRRQPTRRTTRRTAAARRALRYPP